MYLTYGKTNVKIETGLYHFEDTMRKCGNLLSTFSKSIQVFTYDYETAILADFTKYFSIETIFDFFSHCEEAPFSTEDKQAAAVSLQKFSLFTRHQTGLFTQKFRTFTKYWCVFFAELTFFSFSYFHKMNFFFRFLKKKKKKREFLQIQKKSPTRFSSLYFVDIQ